MLTTGRKFIQEGFVTRGVDRPATLTEHLALMQEVAESEISFGKIDALRGLIVEAQKIAGAV